MLKDKLDGSETKEEIVMYLHRCDCPTLKEKFDVEQMEVKALELEVKNPELKDKRRRKAVVKPTDSKKVKTLLGIKKETKEVTLHFI